MISTLRVILVLLASLLGLLAAAVVFAILYLRCFKDNNIRDKERVKDNQDIGWRKCVFRSDKKCKECEQVGAFVALACGDFYHLKCLNKTQEWACPACKKAIKKVKVFCPACL